MADTQWGPIPGKAQGDTCWYPYGGKEYTTDRFWWIVMRGPGLSLSKNDGKGPPGNAVKEGVQIDNQMGDDEYYSAVAITEWGTIPGKAQGSRCWYPYGGKEYTTADFSWVVYNA